MFPSKTNRCTQLESQVLQLQTEASEARNQLASILKAHESLRAEADRRAAAVKAAAAQECEAMQARHAAKIKKLQETAKDQVGWLVVENECVCVRFVCVVLLGV